jgi:crotonobetainyl-CoA:carnitine CoA-transferase CaiB-like acyl-CoA transferase
MSTARAPLTAAPPLAGMKVVDFSRLFAGPYATMTLADLGADVIKVESPAGDEARHFGPPFLGGEGMNFMALNRHKRSITLDMKKPGALEVARRLCADADVVIENFRPGVADQLGVGYDDLSSDNPGLVYCSISGFGQTGPYSSRPALDVVLQAMAGVMDRQGGDGAPELLVVTVADTYAAALAVQSILAALLARGRDGNGQRVDVTLFEALIASQGYRIISPSDRVMLPGFDDTCPYGAFKAGDGNWLVIGVATDKSWHGLCDALGIPEIADKRRFATNPARVLNREELLGLLEQRFLEGSRDQWLDLLEKAGVPVGPVRRVEDLMTDPQVLARGTVVELEHARAGKIRTLGSTLHLERTPTSVGQAPPIQGEHGAEILTGLGYSDDEVKLLIKTEVLNVPD